MGVTSAVPQVCDWFKVFMSFANLIGSHFCVLVHDVCGKAQVHHNTHMCRHSGHICITTIWEHTQAIMRGILTQSTHQPAGSNVTPA